MHTATTNTPEHVMKASNPIPLPVKKLQKTHNQGLAPSKLPPNNTFIRKKIHSSCLGMVQYLLSVTPLIKKQQQKTKKTTKNPTLGLLLSVPRKLNHIKKNSCQYALLKHYLSTMKMPPHFLLLQKSSLLLLQKTV